jgi:transposase-like protein
MATREARQQLQHEVALRLANGEKVNDVAEELGISRITLWRWNNQAIAEAMPHMDDRDEWREELTGVIADRIRETSTKGDDRSLVALVDRLAKLNGLDHSHRVDEARLQLDSARVRLLAERMATALNAAGVPPEQQVKVLELVAGDG